MFTLLAGWFWPPYAFILTFAPPHEGDAGNRYIRGTTMMGSTTERAVISLQYAWSKDFGGLFRFQAIFSRSIYMDLIDMLSDIIQRHNPSHQIGTA